MPKEKRRLAYILNHDNWPREINGKMYNNLPEAVKDKTLNKHNLTYERIYNRINRCNFSSIEKVFNKPLRKLTYPVNNKIFYSLADACSDPEVNIHKLTEEQVRARIYWRTSSTLEEIFKDEAVDTFTIKEKRI